MPLASAKARRGSGSAPVPLSQVPAAATAAAEAGSSATAAPSKPSATGAIREALIRHKRDFVPGEVPLCVLPEGITHNGCSLLRFFPGAFESGTPVQPAMMMEPFRYSNDHAFLGTTGQHLVRLLLSPYIVLAVTLLPVYLPSEAEKSDAAAMAEGVRARMAQAARLPLSNYGAKELRAEWKA